MNRFTLNLSPSKPLCLSSHTLEILSKTFEEHHLSVDVKSLNKELLLEISFDQKKETLKKKLVEVEKKARKTKVADPTYGDELKYKTLMNVVKGLKMELDAATANFFVRITEDHVIIEARSPVLVPTFLLEGYFSEIMRLICEAYSKMGHEILLIES